LHPPSTCSRASLKTDAFAYNHATLIQIPVEEKNLMPVTTLDLKTALIVVDLQKASDIVVTKRTWGAFASRDLEGQLQANGAAQVVVTGVNDILNLLATRSA
jgi:Isochorismatase family